MHLVGRSRELGILRSGLDRSESAVHRISGLSGWSRRCDAVEDLVDCWEGPTTGNETADALVSQRPRRY